MATKITVTSDTNLRDRGWDVRATTGNVVYGPADTLAAAYQTRGQVTLENGQQTGDRVYLGYQPTTGTTHLPYEGLLQELTIDGEQLAVYALDVDRLDAAPFLGPVLDRMAAKAGAAVATRAAAVAVDDATCHCGNCPRCY